MKKKQDIGVIVVIVLAVIVSLGIIAIVVNGVVNFKGEKENSSAESNVKLTENTKELEGQIEGQVKKILSDDKLLVFNGAIDTVNPLLDKTSETKISKVIYNAYTYDLKTEEKRKFENISFYDNHTISPTGEYLVYEKFRLWEEAGQAINILNTGTGEVSNIKFPEKVNLTNTYWIDDKNFYIGLQGKRVAKVNIETKEVVNTDIEGTSNTTIIGGENTDLYYYVYEGIQPTDDISYSRITVKKKNLRNNSIEMLNQFEYGGAPKYYFYDNGYILYGSDRQSKASPGNKPSVIRKYDLNGKLIQDLGGNLDIGSAEDFKISSDGKYVFHRTYNGVGKQQVESINLDTKKVTVLVKASEIIDIQYDKGTNKLIVNARDKYDPQVYSYIVNIFENVEFMECLTKQENIDNANKAEDILNNRINGVQKENRLYRTEIINGKTYYYYDADIKREYPYSYYISLDGDIIENGKETLIESYESLVLPRVSEIIQRKY